MAKAKSRSATIIETERNSSSARQLEKQAHAETVSDHFFSTFWFSRFLSRRQAATSGACELYLEAESSGMNLRAEALMQYRFPVGAGPSGNTCAVHAEN